MPTPEEQLTTHAEQLDAQHGEASTRAKGVVVDDAWHRRHYALANALADALDVPFLPLAKIQSHTGFAGIQKSIEALPSTPAADAARDVMSLASIARSRTPQALSKALEPSHDANLDRSSQAALWVTLLRNGWAALSGPDAPVPVDQSTYPEAASVAEALDVSYEDVAFIQHKGGRKALRTLLGAMPFVDNAEAISAQW